MAAPFFSNSHSNSPDGSDIPPRGPVQSHNHGHIPSPRLDPDYRKIRRAHRSFGARATLLSVGSFILYVLLSCFSPDLMDLQVTGRITLGLLGGLAQFLIMAATVWFYAVRMRSRVDPIVDRFREEERQRAEQQRQTIAPSPRGFHPW
jgi:uncharacterized membrane protein (DUF485 family)